MLISDYYFYQIEHVYSCAKLDPSKLNRRINSIYINERDSERVGRERKRVGEK